MNLYRVFINDNGKKSLSSPMNYPSARSLFNYKAKQSSDLSMYRGRPLAFIVIGKV